MRLVHPYPVSAVVGVAVGLLLVLHRGTFDVGLVLRAALVVLSSQASVGAINDYADREADAVFQPKKPVPRGLVRPGHALAIGVLTAAACVVLASTFGPGSVALAAGGTAAGIAYDVRLKHTVSGVAAYVAGFLTLLTWVLLTTHHLNSRVWPLYPAGAVLIVAAYLANALPDIETDRAQGQSSLPVRLGPARSFAVTLVLTFGAVVVALTASLIARSVPGTSLVTLAGCLTLSAMVSGLRGRLSRSSRKTAFRLLAPALGLLMVSWLLVVPLR